VVIFISVPAYQMEVHVKSPPAIVWYWVLKQNLDRLKDAVADERADNRSEFIFGFSGIALGTLRDMIATFTIVFGGKVPSVWDFLLTLTFFVSVLAITYFFWFVRSPKKALDTIITEITEKEYAANVTGTSSESGRGL